MGGAYVSGYVFRVSCSVRVRDVVRGLAGTLSAVSTQPSARFLKADR